MFVVPSTVQLLLTVMLLVLSVCGNLMNPFLSYHTPLSCPHTTALTALDITATLIGPGLMFVTLITGPAWLEHNQSLCQALSVLSYCVQISCFLVLFFLALFCQKVYHNANRDERRRVIRREFAFLVVCLLIGLLWGVIPLFGWSSYQDLPILHSCLFANRFHSISNYSFFYLVFSFVVLLITALLALRAKNLPLTYSMQFFWKRHESEMKMNDPELTTVGSSNSLRASVYESGIGCFQSKQQSSRSSMSSHRRTDVLSLGQSSPALSRKSSRQVRELDNSILEIRFSNIQQRNNQGFSQSANASDRNPGEDTVSLKTDASVSSSTSRLKGSNRSSQSRAHSAILREIPRDPCAISSRIPNIFPLFLARKNHFLEHAASTTSVETVPTAAYPVTFVVAEMLRDRTLLASSLYHSCAAALCRSFPTRIACLL